MRRILVASVLLLGTVVNRASASDPTGTGSEGLMLVNAQMAQELRSHAAKLGTQTNPAQAETVYVGYTPTQFIPGWVENNNPALSPGRNNNYWQIWAGYGPELISPTKSHTYHVAFSSGFAGSGAMWDWENQVRGDSLQGWWPQRAIYTFSGNQVRPDENRPWWAIDIGNTANYTINERRGGPWTGADTNPGFRTFGVIGVWHMDDAGAPVAAPGTAPTAGPQWTVLSGSRSAWMGLRQHGDTRFSDPLTHNPFNEDVLMLNQISSVSSSGNDKSFPGYGSQMDQMLYRDVNVPSGSALKLDFKWRTNISTGFGTAGTSRTGWFDKDPLAFTTGNVAPNNYISSTTAGANAPRDSFMVYVGAPVTDSTFVASNGDNSYRVFDPQHRWFAETIRANEGLYKEVLSVAGDNPATTSSITIPAATLSPMLSASGGRIRVVFRVKTNRGFDDEDLIGSSLGKGAAVVDDIKTTIVSTGATPWGPSGVGFESDGDIDNRTTVNALNAFKSTGKPPLPLAHVHRARNGTLLIYDLCGDWGTASRQCNSDGVIMSIGDHDHGEAAGGQDDGTADSNPNDNMVSPAIQLDGPYNLPQQNLGNGPTNAMGLDATSVKGTEDYYVDYEIYTGVMDTFTKGNVWRWGFMSYPGNSRAQTGIPSYPAWGQIRYPAALLYNPDQICFRDLEPARQQSLIKTSNPNNIPDSIRFVLGKSQQCWRFGVPISCSPTDGTYFDNVSLAIINRQPAPLAYEGANWGTYQDAFPTNTTIAPGINAVAFDTTGAILKTGLNIAPTTADDFRFDVPGDTTYVIASGAGRVDMVFRILPGPGNYLTVGRTDNSNTLTGNNPSVRSALNHNDDSQFWTQYMYNPGPYGTPNGHGSGARGTRVWNPNAWNSARCDTAEANAFANQNNAAFVLGGPPDPSIWMATYQESEYGTAGSPGPRRALVLNYPRNQCYVKSPNDLTQGFVCDGTVPSSIACNGVGADCPATGYQANSNVRLEGVKIIPDGLLTPGSHVEYFFRREDGGVLKGTVPDTNVVTPQRGGNSTDGDRWSEFSILPDRWKDNTYHHPLTNQPGLGNACLLVLDYNDRRGNERVWVSIADSIGATQQVGWGAHNGWHAIGGGDLNDPDDNRLPDPSDHYGGLPAGHGFVAAHGGQPGYRGRWDMYQVRASESLNKQAGSLGSKLGNSNPGNILDGYRSRQGATPDQLAYYKMIFIMSGDLSSGILGPFANRSQNDCGLLTNWLQNGAAPPAPLNRAFWAMGDGFAQDAVQEEDCQYNLLTDYLGVDLDNPNYIVVSGNYSSLIDLSPTDVITGAAATPFHGDRYGIRNVCLWSNDVLLRTAVPSPNTADASFYGPSKNGPGTPFLAGAARTSRTVSRPYLSLVDGWDIEHLTSVNDYDTRGRLRYFAAVFANLFGSVSGCTITGTPLISLDVPSNDATLVNFMNVRNNPLAAGEARIHFGLAQADRVEVKVYDVSGRLVRNLADRQFPAGEHEILWDGLDNGGRQVARGVYFTRVKFMNIKFSAARKLTVLK